MYLHDYCEFPWVMYPHSYFQFSILNYTGENLEFFMKIVDCMYFENFQYFFLVDLF